MTNELLKNITDRDNAKSDFRRCGSRLSFKEFTADVVVVDRLPDSVGGSIKFGRPSELVIRGIMVER